MRIHNVKKSQREYVCSKCRQPIEKGHPYRWWKHRYASKTRWHISHGYPGPADLTTSEKLARLYEVQDSMYSALTEYEDNPELFDELEDAITGGIEEARDVGAEYEEGADNIEEYFGETTQVSMMREKFEAIENWTDNLESIDWVNYEDDDERASWIGDVSDLIGEFAV